MGRFLTPDPAGASAANASRPQSWNRYTYVSGDPVNSSDPSGLEGSDETCVVNGVVYPLSCPTLYPLFGPYQTVQMQLGSDPPKLNGRQLLSAAEHLAEQWLEKADCAKLFGSGFNPADVIHSLMLNNSFTSGLHQIVLSSTPGLPWGAMGATTYWENPLADLLGPLGNILGSGAAIVFNTSAFEGYPDPVAIKEGAVTLIHELGHAYNFTGGSGGTNFEYDNPLALGNQAADAASARNDEKIYKNCGQRQ